MAESTFFSATVPDQTMEILLLVENSQAMSYIWDDLRDRHLQKLMDKLHPSELATDLLNVWVLESQPLQASPTTQPRRYHNSRHALSDVFLNYMPENRISSARIDSAIQFLASLASSGGTQGRPLHFIIVAVSTPVDNGDVNPASDMNATSQHSTWAQLAEKLAQANIYCHILTTRAKEDMSALTTLFNETLRLGGTAEDLVSFPADPEVSLRSSTSSAVLDKTSSYGESNPPRRPVRIAMPPRRNTFPQDSGYTEQIVEEPPHTSSHSPEMDPPPSLVSQLQQVHGLTKKKVYGAKPQRKPFFKDERVERQERNFPVPAAVAMVPGPPPYLPDSTIQQQTGISASGGRVMSLSKADRHARLQASPIDMQGRRHLAWSGRSSRIASPELMDPTSSPASLGGFSDVSPTASYISSDVSSPITPCSNEEYYGVHLQTTPASSELCGHPSIVEGGGSDPTWLQASYTQGYITSTGQTMAPIAHGYYIPNAPGASPPYYEHGVDVYANTVVTHEVPSSAVVLVTASGEAVAKPPANHLPLEAAPPPVTISPPAPSEAPVTQTSPPLPAVATSTKKAKRKQEVVDDKDYIILDQQFADYGASINEEFVNMLKEKDAEKVRERQASGTEDIQGASQAELGASSASYAASTDAQGYLPGRGGDLIVESSNLAALSPPSPHSRGSISPLPDASSLSSSTEGATVKTTSVLLPPLASSSTTSNASLAAPLVGPANEKVNSHASSASLDYDGSYSASCYPLPIGFATPPSQQTADPRFLPAIPSCITVQSGVYSYRQSVAYPSRSATASKLTSNSLTGWAG